MASSDALAFWAVFLIVFFINIFAPIIGAGFDQQIDERDTSEIDPSTPASGLAVLGFTIFNIFLVPFWTIGMPVLMNVIIMIPLRILGWILIFRMFRGN